MYKLYNNDIRYFYNYKIMMWIFLLSDLLTFCGLLTAFFSLKYNNILFWPKSENIFTYIPLLPYKLPLVFVGIMTLILIVSSVSMVMTIYEYKKKNYYYSVIYLLITIFIGLLFVLCQTLEWYNLYKEGFWFGYILHEYTSNFSNIFFTITGFHGIHVIVGIILNIIIFIKIIKNENVNLYPIIDVIGLYWHFVDLIWVFIFTFIYLI